MPPRAPKEPGLKLVDRPAATAKTATKPGTTAASKAGKSDAKPAAKRAAEPAIRTVMLKLPGLVDAVASALGGKKKDAKLAVEVTLAELAAALRRGDGLMLPLLGRARVVKSADKDGSATLTVKLRLADAVANPGADKAKTGADKAKTAGGKVKKQALADDSEDS
jgi:nucleoid DNA-binding protein